MKKVFAIIIIIIFVLFVISGVSYRVMLNFDLSIWFAILYSFIGLVVAFLFAVLCTWAICELIQ